MPLAFLVSSIAGLFFLCTFLIGIFTTVFWIWMLIDCVTREPSGTEKLAWVLIILFTHFLGALIYYVVRRPQRRR